MTIEKSSLGKDQWYTAPKHQGGEQLSMLSTKQTLVHNIQILQKHHTLDHHHPAERILTLDFEYLC
jgi:hypothetical protein